jgi:hypothetical protein
LLRCSGKCVGVLLIECTGEMIVSHTVASFFSLGVVHNFDAHIPVPKLVKKGFNSSFGVLVSFEGMDSEWITETVANGKK